MTVEDRAPSEGARFETELVLRCAGGDAEAWEVFVERFGPLLAGLARRMLARRAASAHDADVDEVLSGVFLALLRRERVLLRRYDPRWRLSTYLGVICRTEVNRHLRRTRREPARLAEPSALADPASGAAPEHGIEADERRQAVERLREALATLAERDRLLLSMRYLDGLDYRTIAAALEVSPQSVGPLLHRAKERLAGRVPALRAFVLGEGERGAS